MSAKPILSWKSIPFLERPYQTLFLISILTLMMVLLWQITVINWASPTLYIISMLILILNLLPYFIMTRYEFYEDKLVVYYMFVRVVRNYADFGCFYKDKYGVMLGTFKRPRRLDLFRGQSIRFSKDKSEMNELLLFLSNKIGKQY